MSHKLLLGRAAALTFAGSLVALVACVGDALTLPTTNCDPPNEFCGGACTNLQNDPRNCGACGKGCNTAMGETCQRGACGPPCTGGTTRCGSACLDVQNDVLNCGDCGKKCGAGEACTGGKCTLLCRSGLNVCPRAGAPGPTDAGAHAEGGASDAGSVTGSASECVDLQSDPDNCGKCGTVCPADKSFCDFGQCKLYKFAGIKTNLDPVDLSPRWTECFAEPYNSQSSVANLQSKCPQANLLVGCRAQGQKILVTAAMAPRGDVFFDTGQNQHNFRLANGVAWYFNPSYSMGYANPLDTLTHFTCDTSAGAFPERRLCWHTSGGLLSPGYRCGTNITSSTNFERVIYQTP